MPRSVSLDLRAAIAVTAVQTLNFLPVVFSMMTLAWLVHGLDRGLELTDESFYLLIALHPESIRLFFSPTHWVSGAIWQVTQSLFAFRAVGLGLTVVSSMLLAWGALSVAARAGWVVAGGRLSQAKVFSATVSGALLYGSLMSFTPSYNLLGASGAYVAMGLGLLSISDERAGRASLLAAAAGIALGITVLCKFSTGVCTAGLLLVLQGVFTWKQPGRRIDSLLMLMCAVATIGAAVLWKTGIAEATRQFGAGVEIVWFAQGDKATSSRVIRSALDIGGMLMGVVTSFWGPLALFALGAFWRPMIMGCIGAVFFALLLATGDHLTAGASRFGVQALPLAASLCLVLLINIRQWCRTAGSLFLVLALIALPLAIALGTGNPLQVQILTALAPWGTLIGLTAVSSPRTGFPSALIGAMFCLTVLLQTVSNSVEPYRLRSLAEQTETVMISQLGSVQVDAGTAALVRDMKKAAEVCDIKPGTPFLDFYNLPAVALMIGAVPVNSPWLLDPDYGAMALKLADPVTLRNSAIAVKLDEKGNLPKPPSQLEAFPGGFRLCGRSLGPIDGFPIQLWAAQATRAY